MLPKKSKRTGRKKSKRAFIPPIRRKKRRERENGRPVKGVRRTPARPGSTRKVRGGMGGRSAARNHPQNKGPLAERRARRPFRCGKVFRSRPVSRQAGRNTARLPLFHQASRNTARLHPFPTKQTAIPQGFLPPLSRQVGRRPLPRPADRRRGKGPVRFALPPIASSDCQSHTCRKPARPPPANSGSWLYHIYMDEHLGQSPPQPNDGRHRGAHRPERSRPRNRSAPQPPDKKSGSPKIPFPVIFSAKYLHITLFSLPLHR